MMANEEKLVWFIKASDPSDNYETFGSAVAIRLQKNGEPQSARTYLITCAHVLRRKAKDGSPGYGALLPKICAWQSDSAFTDKLAWKVMIDSDIKTLSPDEVPQNERAVVADDWIVLKFESETKSLYIDAVKKWADNHSDKQKYIIIGYPGGSGAFPLEVVKPTTLSQDFPLREESNGYLTSIGTETRSGTSGGGLFDTENKAFAGIHRSSKDAVVQVQAVSAKKIREILSERGYTPPRNDASSLFKQSGFREKGAELQRTTAYFAEKLKQIVEQTAADERQLKEIYAESLPINLRKRYQFSQEKVNESLENLFDMKYNIQFEEYGFVACVFAVVIGESFAVMLDIEEWIRHANEEMKWKFQLDDVKTEARLAIKRIQVNKESQVTEYLQVKVTALSADNIHVKAEFFNRSQSDEPAPDPDKITTTLTELPNEIAKRIADDTLVELFLPTELMYENFEFAGEKKHKFLIVENTVVRRFADRQKVPNFTKQTMATKKQLRPFNNWKERWEKLMSEDSTMLNLFHPIKLCELDSTNSVSNLIIDLKSKRDICCTGCDVFPDKYEYFDDFFQSHIDSGVPIMFWPGKSFGESKPPLDLETIRNTHFSVGAKLLLTQLRKIQLQYLKESQSDFYKENLFVIYDNPNEMLPTVRAD